MGDAQVLLVYACLVLVAVGAGAVLIVTRLIAMLADAQDRNMTLSGTLAQYQMSKAPEPIYPPELTINHPITQAPIRVVHQGGGVYGQAGQEAAAGSTVADVEGAPAIDWQDR